MARREEKGIGPVHTGHEFGRAAARFGPQANCHDSLLAVVETRYAESLSEAEGNLGGGRGGHRGEQWVVRT